MAKASKAYVCQSCGAVTARWTGKCPSCNAWNTILEEAVMPTGSPALIGPSTFFIPGHRLVRVDLDESTEVVSSYGDRYRQACGLAVEEVLEGPRIEAED